MQQILLTMMRPPLKEVAERFLSCSIQVENVFGPVVASSCLGGFDFTLLYEETVLTILPLSVAGALVGYFYARVVR